jgi:hypothetical protein
MERLEVSCAVQPIYGSLSAKGLMYEYMSFDVPVLVTSRGVELVNHCKPVMFSDRDACGLDHNPWYS